MAGEHKKYDFEENQTTIEQVIGDLNDPSLLEGIARDLLSKKKGTVDVNDLLNSLQNKFYSIQGTKHPKVGSPAFFREHRNTIIARLDLNGILSKARSSVPSATPPAEPQTQTPQSTPTPEVTPMAKDKDTPPTQGQTASSENVSPIGEDKPAQKVEAITPSAEQASAEQASKEEADREIEEALRQAEQTSKRAREEAEKEQMAVKIRLMEECRDSVTQLIRSRQNQVKAPSFMQKARGSIPSERRQRLYILMDAVGLVTQRFEEAKMTGSLKTSDVQAILIHALKANPDFLTAIEKVGFGYFEDESKILANSQKGKQLNPSTQRGQYIPTLNKEMFAQAKSVYGPPTKPPPRRPESAIEQDKRDAAANAESEKAEARQQASKDAFHPASIKTDADKNVGLADIHPAALEPVEQAQEPVAGTDNSARMAELLGDEAESGLFKQPVEMHVGTAQSGVQASQAEVQQPEVVKSAEQREAYAHETSGPHPASIKTDVDKDILAPHPAAIEPSVESPSKNPQQPEAEQSEQQSEVPQSAEQQREAYAHETSGPHPASIKTDVDKDILAPHPAAIEPSVESPSQNQQQPEAEQSRPQSEAPQSVEQQPETPKAPKSETVEQPAAPVQEKSLELNTGLEQLRAESAARAKKNEDETAAGLAAIRKQTSSIPTPATPTVPPLAASPTSYGPPTKLPPRRPESAIEQDKREAAAKAESEKAEREARQKASKDASNKAANEAEETAKKHAQTATEKAKQEGEKAAEGALSAKTKAADSANVLGTQAEVGVADVGSSAAKQAEKVAAQGEQGASKAREAAVQAAKTQERIAQENIDRFRGNPPQPSATSPATTMTDRMAGVSLIKHRKDLQIYIEHKTTDKSGKDVKLHGSFHGLLSDQKAKKTIAQTLEKILNSSPSAADQLVAIRQAIRANADATGPQLGKGELAKILSNMEKEVMTELSKNPKEKAIAELADYVQILTEQKLEKGESKSILSRFKTDQGDKLTLAKDIMKALASAEADGLAPAKLDAYLKTQIETNKKITVSTPFKTGRLNKILDDLLHRDDKKPSVQPPKKSK